MTNKDDSISDEALFPNIQEGNEKAFDILFLRYYSRLCAYAKQYVGLDDGQEIVQDVMVWVWQNSKVQIIDTSVRSYLFKAVKNRCMSTITRSERHQQIIQSVYEGVHRYEDPDFYVVEELVQNIDTALKRLPESYREAFEMNRFQYKTYQEIAQQLNVSPKTVDYRIQQALKLLRKELKDYLPFLLYWLYYIAEN